MNYYVADTYKNMERVGEPIKKNGKLYTAVEGTCDRCGGTGVFACRVENGHPVPHPAYGGVCLKCGGEGKIRKTVRLYTEGEYRSAQRAKANRKAKAEEAAAERRSKRFDNWLKKNGFDEEGNTYLVYGNTYPIKDQLKEQGYKFSKELLWHGPAAVDVPEDCFVEQIHYSKVYGWNKEAGEMWRVEGGQEFLEQIFSKNSEGEYVGEVGERLRNLTVTFEEAKTFEGAYGVDNIYKFNYGGAQLVWFTAVDKDLEPGAEYTLSGTVKAHKIYRNEKTTQLSRCLIK